MQEICIRNTGRPLDLWRKMYVIVNCFVRNVVIGHNKNIASLAIVTLRQIAFALLDRSDLPRGRMKEPFNGYDGIEIINQVNEKDNDEITDKEFKDNKLNDDDDDDDIQSDEDEEDLQIQLLMPFLDKNQVMQRSRDDNSQTNESEIGDQIPAPPFSFSLSVPSTLAQTIPEIFTPFASDIHRLILDCVTQLTETRPHTLSSGWRIIFLTIQQLVKDTNIHFRTYLMLEQLLKVSLDYQARLDSSSEDQQLSITQSVVPAPISFPDKEQQMNGDQGSEYTTNRNTNKQIEQQNIQPHSQDAGELNSQIQPPIPHKINPQLKRPHIQLSYFFVYSISEVCDALCVCAMCATMDRVTTGCIKYIDRLLRIFLGRRSGEKVIGNSSSQGSDVNTSSDINNQQNKNQPTLVESIQTNPDALQPIFNAHLGVLDLAHVVHIHLPFLCVLSRLACHRKQQLRVYGLTSLLSVLNDYGRIFTGDIWSIIWNRVCMPILESVREGLVQRGQVQWGQKTLQMSAESTLSQNQDVQTKLYEFECERQRRGEFDIFMREMVQSNIWQNVKQQLNEQLIKRMIPFNEQQQQLNDQLGVWNGGWMGEKGMVIASSYELWEWRDGEYQYVWKRQSQSRVQFGNKNDKEQFNRANIVGRSFWRSGIYLEMHHVDKGGRICLCPDHSQGQQQFNTTTQQEKYQCQCSGQHLKQIPGENDQILSIFQFIGQNSQHDLYQNQYSSDESLSINAFTPPYCHLPQPSPFRTKQHRMILSLTSPHRLCSCDCGCLSEIQQSKERKEAQEKHTAFYSRFMDHLIELLVDSILHNVNTTLTNDQIIQKLSKQQQQKENGIVRRNSSDGNQGNINQIFQQSITRGGQANLSFATRSSMLFQFFSQMISQPQSFPLLSRPFWVRLMRVSEYLFDATIPHELSQPPQYIEGEETPNNYKKQHNEQSNDDKIKAENNLEEFQYIENESEGQDKIKDPDQDHSSSEDASSLKSLSDEDDQIENNKVTQNKCEFEEVIDKTLLENQVQQNNQTNVWQSKEIRSIDDQNQLFCQCMFASVSAVKASQVSFNILNWKCRLLYQLLRGIERLLYAAPPISTSVTQSNQSTDINIESTHNEQNHKLLGIAAEDIIFGLICCIERTVLFARAFNLDLRLRCALQHDNIDSMLLSLHNLEQRSSTFLFSILAELGKTQAITNPSHPSIIQSEIDIKHEETTLHQELQADSHEHTKFIFQYCSPICGMRAHRLLLYHTFSIITDGSILASIESHLEDMPDSDEQNTIPNSYIRYTEQGEQNQNIENGLNNPTQGGNNQIKQLKNKFNNSSRSIYEIKDGERAQIESKNARMRLENEKYSEDTMRNLLADFGYCKQCWYLDLNGGINYSDLQQNNQKQDKIFKAHSLSPFSFITCTALAPSDAVVTMLRLFSSTFVKNMFTDQLNEQINQQKYENNITLYSHSQDSSSNLYQQLFNSFQQDGLELSTKMIHSEMLNFIQQQIKMLENDRSPSNTVQDIKYIDSMWIARVDEIKITEKILLIALQILREVDPILV
ncbi:MAG: hypothetical protein EZS28_000535 [Streblomastix strix]|uniref:Mon2/Sec7/BIG1-like HDS domain-containing protein n=1 Tax=Streblomastix strix TaxID=222440 RepID=A0A5J4X9V3_9EUKA|nr:MAG: hypothetical protein EZS28_000535 [Streblomastix strix]